MSAADRGSAGTRGRRWLGVAAGAFLALAASAASAVDIGAPAPTFSLLALNGNERVDLAKYRGKVVFVDFWASWCGPCRQSLPFYEKLNTELSHDDFAILAVNLDDEVADANAFLKEHPVTYKVLADPAGGVPKAFGVLGMPASYIIDRDGIVRARHIGFTPADVATITAEIHSLMEKPRDAH
ncbi:MAG TPA: TlpA disulfide reductase family protein [Rudaea sp.]|nr:TlpA disulfide reductase family protein [Rudaea sp.]